MSRSTLFLMPAPKDMTDEAKAAARKAANEVIRKRAMDALRAEFQKLVDEYGSVTAVEEACGLSQSAISDVKNGKRGLGSDLLAVAAAHLKRSVDSFLGFEEKVPASAQTALDDGRWRDLYEILRNHFERVSPTQVELEKSSLEAEPKLPRLPPGRKTRRSDTPPRGRTKRNG